MRSDDQLTETLLDAARKLEDVRYALLGIVADLGGPIEADPDFLNVQLNDIDFGNGTTARLRNAFANRIVYTREGARPAPLITVRDLMGISVAELLREPNVGRLTMISVLKVLASHGLTMEGGEYYSNRRRKR